LIAKHRPPVKRISLAAEVDELRAAISAARILVDEHATLHIGSPHDERLVPAAVSAVLTLVDMRAKDVCRVLRREKDPAAIWSHTNAVQTNVPDDLVLVGWAEAVPPRQRQRSARSRKERS